MNINDAFNKICIYSCILGYGKNSDNGKLIECSGATLYNNIIEHCDDMGRYLELDINIVKCGNVIGHYKASYMFPNGDVSVFSSLEGDALRGFVDVMLVAATYVSSFGRNEECSFGILNNIIKFSEDLGRVSDKATLLVK